MKPQLVPTVVITLQASYWILGLYAAVSMLSVLSICLAQLPVWGKLALCMVVIIATIYYIMRDVLLCLPSSWHQVLLSSHGKLTLINQSKEVFVPVLLATSVNHPLLTVLHFKRSPRRLGWRSAVMLTPRLVNDADQFRRLRVWLKWSHYAAVLEADAAEVAD